MPYLIDKSALARMQHPTVEARLAPIIESGEAATCSIVDLEVLYSTRNRDEHARVRARRMFAYRKVDLTEAVFSRGGRCPRASRRSRPAPVPIPDLIIAAVAEAARMTVLHYDADFDAIAAVTGQDVEWVVPRGSL